MTKNESLYNKLTRYLNERITKTNALQKTLAEAKVFFRSCFIDVAY